MVRFDTRSDFWSLMTSRLDINGFDCSWNLLRPPKFLQCLLWTKHPVVLFLSSLARLDPRSRRQYSELQIDPVVLPRTKKERDSVKLTVGCLLAYKPSAYSKMCFQEYWPLDYSPSLRTKTACAHAEQPRFLLAVLCWKFKNGRLNLAHWPSRGRLQRPSKPQLPSKLIRPRYSMNLNCHYLWESARYKAQNFTFSNTYYPWIYLFLHAWSYATCHGSCLCLSTQTGSMEVNNDNSFADCSSPCAFTIFEQVLQNLIRHNSNIHTTVHSIATNY